MFKAFIISGSCISVALLLLFKGSTLFKTTIEEELEDIEQQKYIDSHMSKRRIKKAK